MANDDEKRSPDDAEDEREALEGEEDEQDSHDGGDGDDEGADDSTEEDDSDEGADDSESDDDGSAEEAAAGAASAKKKTGRKHKASGKVSAGQRLAAAKAAKAAKKIAQRGKEAEVVEEQAVETATVASTWLERNRKKLLGAFAAVLLVGGAFFGIRAMQQKSAAEASQLLWEATEILNAPIRAADEDAAEDATAETDEDEVTYETIAARADAALAKLNELFASHADSPAAAWGRLEEGRALYQKGQHAEARTAFEAALAQGGEALAPRALEGIAFTFESEENWDEAVARFDQLREEGGALQILADYHLARIHLAKDEEDPAKTKLQAVLEALREEDAPELAYVRDQAELRLMAIDSSLVQRDAAGQMDPAEMQRLIEQLTRQQQQQGGAP